MTQLLLVAPGIEPPLTEGRKLFVTELVDWWRARGLAVEVLDGGALAGGRGILRSLRDLQARVGGATPDTVALVFPFGTYTGLRGYVNRFLIRRALSICRKAGVFVRPVFYSCAGPTFEQFQVRYAPAFAVGRSGDGVTALHLGTSRVMPERDARSNTATRLLFLCGYQAASRGALHSVLYERGLIDVLQAGNTFAREGAKLTVAIPFLRDASVSARLSLLAQRLCGDLEISLISTGSPLDLLANHDVFLFPYRAEHAVFVPTSLLEATQMGVPVLAADQMCYRSLTRGDAAGGCRLYRPGDPSELATQFVQLMQDYQAVAAAAALAAQRVRETWTLARSVEELAAMVPALNR